MKKPILFTTLLGLIILGLYYYFYGFSQDRWVRYGQYGSLCLVGILAIDAFLREQ